MHDLDTSPLLPISEGLEATVLALNNANAAELSWLEPRQLGSLLSQAFYARRIGALDAFLLAFDEGAAYDSPNYLWFRQRYPRFIYIDRIVVASQQRERGHARRLYADLFAQAVAAGHDRVVCEVNTDPPNPGSDGFHAALGFAEVGRAAIHNGEKSVRYLSRPLRPSYKPTAA